MKTSRTADASPRLLFHEDTGDIADLIRTRLAESGRVIIDVPDLSVARFGAMAREVTPYLLRYPSLRERRFATDDGLVQEIDGARDHVAPHCELAYSPVRPDVCYFGCLSPADNGGETLLADGQLVWESLSAESRSLFLENEIVYLRRYQSAPWHALFGVERVEDVADFLNRDDNFAFEHDASGAVLAQYRCPAQHRRAGGSLAFANSLPGIRHGDLEFCALLSTGHSIPAIVWDDIERAVETCTERVLLIAGQIAVIDNWRVMHGREKYDRSRRMLSAFGFHHATLPGHVERRRGAG